MKTEGRFFVLLRCGYDGDGNLFEDDFVACGSLEAMKHQVPLGAACYLPGQEVPDDGYYGDERARYRMIEVAPLGGTFVPFPKMQDSTD